MLFYNIENADLVAKTDFFLLSMISGGSGDTEDGSNCYGIFSFAIKKIN